MSLPWVEGEVSALYETVNAVNLKGNLGYKKDNFSINLNGGTYRFGGLSTNAAPRNLNWENKNQYFANLQYNQKINDLKLRYSVGYSYEKLAYKGEPNRFGKIQDKDYYTRRIDNSVALNGDIYKKYYLNMSISYLDYQRFHNTFNIDPETFQVSEALKDNKKDNIVQYNYLGFKSQLAQNRLNKHLGYALGLDLKKETTKGERILNKSQNLNTYAFFGSLNYKLNRVIELQPAFRCTLNDAFGSLLSPAFNAIIKHKTNSLRFSYARGFRAPSLKELFLDFRIKQGPNTFIISGNKDLKVEKSHSFHLLYTYNMNLKNEKKLSFEPSLFYNNINSLIALSEMKNFIRHYININKFKSLGGTLDLTYKSNNNFYIKSGFSVIGRYNKFEEDYDTEVFLYTPEARFNTSYTINSIDLDVNAFYKYTGERTGFYWSQI